MNYTRAYRCKAYALIKNRPRLDKIDPKAFDGHLVGDDSQTSIESDPIEEQGDLDIVCYLRRVRAILPYSSKSGCF